MSKIFSFWIFQKYLVFIPAKKHIKCFSGTTRLESRKSDGMTQENIESINKSDSNFVPIFVDYYLLPDMYFNGYCLVKNNISIFKKVIKFYIWCTLNPQLKI